MWAGVRRTARSFRHGDARAARGQPKGDPEKAPPNEKPAAFRRRVRILTVWWTRSRRIRTAASIPVEIPLAETWEPPLYQRIAARAKHLRDLGMTYQEIGDQLGVDRWTIGKAIRWLQRCAME